MEGTVINDRYKAVRELKPARDGKIYWVVEDQQKGKELKMLKGIALFDEKQEEEAKLEVDLLRRLDHPHVVKLLDDISFTAPNNQNYRGLILEYLPGGDLSQFFQKKLENEGGENEEEWEENDALGICAQIVLAMNYLHGENIIHRDIKPENILFFADEKEIKIADFNVSRVTEGTMSTGIAGSMEYIPPESLQAQGNENASFSLDIWAMGIFFQMLCTFRHPFATGNLFQTINNIAQNLRNPAEVVFPAMESLIQECLKIDLGERAANAAALMNHRSIVSLHQILT
ncbi:Oidioi.mRNA.OKI2018_I69.chr2.g8377.t1.cds [Oikopleura dioica]|uniref:Oidioi.mRNA.OKI2018_I69.chr2.g8377.t1.cds n=1 Tax=Oikopleura dioica TaxID=34765 RepID=A0ABN7T9I3_OIKDI|nr:Oidioi.mRNA.OKI2018_I69.chr2.g8377.t1.cds [Oikopleura dioica]